MKENSSKSKIKLISIIIAVIVVIVAATAGIYCVSTDQSPKDAFSSIFMKNDEAIVGYWESDKAPGLMAYRFDSDGTYNTYLSTVIIPGTYEIKGNKLYLRNPSTAKDIVYKITISDDVLTLKTVEEDGRPSETEEVLTYNRVEELNQKTLADLAGDYMQEKENTTEEITVEEDTNID